MFTILCHETVISHFLIKNCKQPCIALVSTNKILWEKGILISPKRFFISKQYLNIKIYFDKMCKIRSVRRTIQRCKENMKVAIYARVSLDAGADTGQFQDPENQLMPLREYAKRQNWEAVEFIEKASGGSNRPIFRAMLGQAMQLRFNGILVWSLDRFSREGILDTLSYIRRLRDRGVWVRSLKEEWLDSSGPFAELMLAQFAWFAEFERRKISERTKGALAKRKALGIKLGRPKRCPKCGWSHKATKQCREPKKTPPLQS